MESASKRSLVVILVATMFIALFGAVSTMDRFGWRALTGAWSDNTTTTHGGVNISIQSNNFINFTDDTVNFGTGYLCAGCTGATIATDGTNDTACNCGGWSSLQTGLMLENQGNKLAILKLSNRKNSSAFFGNLLSGYAWKWETPETAGAANKNLTCIGGNHSVFGPIFGVYTNRTGPEYSVGANFTLCDIFNYTDTADTINFSIKVHINEGASSGDKTDIWTVSATAAN